jgi:parallel beta-helix repeat protein
MRSPLLAAALALALAAAQLPAPAPAPVVPTDGMLISASTLFAAGSYALPHGVSIVADGVTLDLGGAVLVGDGGGNGAGVSVEGRANVTITSSRPGGALRGFFYGVVARNVVDFALSDLDLSANWLAPNASTTWLDINARPSLADKVNLGGGLFLEAAVRADVARVVASTQENGFDVFSSSRVRIRNSTASNNSGWGAHFFNTRDSEIVGCVLDHCVRPGDGDSAGILLVYGSHRNRVAENSCMFGGDGFFIGNENGCPSNFNLVEDNDCSHASANAFEATFSNGNVFRRNRASFSSYGFWLGYSYNTTVEDCEVVGNGNGVDIDHGQHNRILSNWMSNTNGPAVQLTSDGSRNFPQPCLALPNQTYSATTVIYRNTFVESNNYHVILQNTTDSLVIDNYFGGNLRPGAISADALTTASTAFDSGAAPTALTWPARNIVGNAMLGGNW